MQEGDDVLEWATGVAGDKLITCYMHDVKNTMQLRELNTGAEVHKFPLDIGSVTGFSGDIRYMISVYSLLIFLSLPILGTKRCSSSLAVRSRLAPFTMSTLAAVNHKSLSTWRPRCTEFFKNISR